MKPFEWNPQKNEWLKDVRGIGFDDVVYAIITGNVVDKIKHPNTKKYPNQHMYLVRIKEYIWAVPFIEEDGKIFLKTFYKSRKSTKKFVKERKSI